MKRKHSELFYKYSLVSIVLRCVALPSYSQRVESLDPIVYSLLDTDGKQLTQERFDYLVIHGFNDKLWTKGKRYASFGRALELTGFCLALGSGISESYMSLDTKDDKRKKESDAFILTTGLGGISMLVLGQFLKDKGQTIIGEAFGNLDIDIHPSVGPGLVGIILDF